MPKTPKEMERILLKDGWYKVGQRGSHRQYDPPAKSGKVTIPFHTKDLSKKIEHKILVQAQLK